jgi:glycosyltransferase involved in cell wall biosynthesis
VRVTKAVFVTQQIDPAHPNLGAATGLVRGLANEVDEVVVLALRAVPGALPLNCRIREFGATSQVLRGAKFAEALSQELVPRPRIVIAHMSPIYAVLAAPVCRPLGVPIVLWFTHWRPSPTLRVAERVSSAIATVDTSSFPFASHKVHAIGHGVDVSTLPCRTRSEDATFRLLALGRTSPAKGLEDVIDGVRRVRAAGLDARLEIRGPSETDEERAHRARLVDLSGDGVAVEDAVPHSELPRVFANTDLLVNAAAEGSLDKSVFEACASCVPVLASNPGFAGLLPPELLFARGDAADIAGKVTAFAARSAVERAALGHELRARVERNHSTESWAKAILALGR